MRIETQLKYEKMFCGQMRNLFANARRFHWSLDSINDNIMKIIKERAFSALPNVSQEYIRGYWTALYDIHWEYVVFSYCINGVRMSIESEEFKRIPSEEVNKKWSDSGCYVYRDNINALYTKEKKTVSVDN